MNMKNELAQAVDKAISSLGITKTSFKLEYPENPDHGDFSCNVAMVYAKQLSLAPKALAEKIIVELEKYLDEGLNFVSSIEVAGPGFINFKIKDKVFAEQIMAVARGGAEYGWNKNDSDKKVMVEYTDPNPFKIFHIGHLMSNAIGESISRLVEGSGAKVIRACYQGDVGLHVAKTIWAIINKANKSDWQEIIKKDLVTRINFLGLAYADGNSAYEGRDLLNGTLSNNDYGEAKKETELINKKIFEKSDPEINAIYEQGRKWSLEYFDSIYKRLGTTFDQFFFESEVADDGVKVVREFLKKGIFAESEGAIVFKGEDHGLHTRVFITSQGLPTYEAKEIGLNMEKFNKYPDLTESVIVTANEQSDYFKVLLKVFSLIDQNIFTKTKHISHGLLRFATGKMSSRKGNIVSADSLLGDIKALVMEKIANRELTSAEKEEIADMVAIGAIKYTILRQSIGGDVIFDSAASISFEGDSGPYLQYAVVRAGAVLEKSAHQGASTEVQNKNLVAGSNLKGKNVQVLPDSVTLLEKLISRFPDVVERARAEYAPQLVANYLITLAGAFNGYYANHQIIDNTDPLSPYRLELTQAFLTTMTNGLWLLGIKVPKKM